MQDSEQIIERCRELRDQYGRKGNKMTGDQLLDMMDKLSVAYSYLGELEAERNRDANFKYSNRLQVKSSREFKRIAEGEKITQAKSSSESDTEVIQARFEEITHSYLAEQLQNMLKGIKAIMNALDKRLMFMVQDRKQNYKSSTVNKTT